MTVTNRLGLSQPIVDAVLAYRRAYSKGDADFSVTELMQPPYMRRLRMAHHADIVEDVADMIGAFIGNCVHEALERHGGIAAEVRVAADVGGVLVSGQKDRSVPGTIRDYKCCKAYKIKDGVPDDWKRQLNDYRLLTWLDSGEVVDDLAVEVFLLDWSKTEAERDPKYPQTHVVLRPVAAEPMEDIRARMLQSIDEHTRMDAEPCTPEERWAKPDSWAVYKNGNQKASRVLDTLADAEAYMAEKSKVDGDMRIEHRPGDDVRCRSWCNVNFACSYWQARTQEDR